MTHKNPEALGSLAVNLSNPGITGAAAANFFELPFKNSQTDWMAIEVLKLSGSLEQYRSGAADSYVLFDASEELLNLLAQEARGETLDEDDLARLDEDGADLVLDWGDVYEGDGLSVNELRGIQALDAGAWQLKDGRVVQLYAPARIELTPA